MPDTAPIGGPRLWQDLDIPKSADFAFDIVWYQQDEVTIIPILSVVSVVKDKYDGALLLDLGTSGPYTTIDGQGRALVRVPKIVTATLPTMERAVWSCLATSATETVELMAGGVRIREDV